MASLFPFSVVGLGFLFLAALECLSAASAPSFLHPSLTRLRFLASLTLSSLSILSCLISSFLSSTTASDPLGAALPLSSLGAVTPFLLYSFAGLLSLSSSFARFALFPPSLLDLLLLFSFGQEFLLFYLRRKDIDGVENRYFDLLLAPILVCAVSTLLALTRPRSPAPRVGRAAGLALQGTWFIQMGFSFFTNVIADGCFLHERGGVNYTIKCKTHQDYHRGRAIATLQFNCHLALLVLVGYAVYGVMAGRTDNAQGYRPLSKEMQMTDVSPSNFTLDSDEEEEIVTAGTNSAKHQNDVVSPPLADAESSNGPN
ncbi:uncharacterized protein LOC122032903 [Zingiber officinale]|uniref:Uncharacterized protein n=1 Tax=Zingiber officinale TaxID=94328 RepID=A0A8J5EBX1_ZINOF|nr:uncharacterized protein LOC122032903 [Zingiber officinale]KAG6470957.1 hypothetical protein ZIOFF_072046 [Zingiber officinale]